MTFLYPIDSVRSGARTRRQMAIGALHRFGATPKRSRPVAMLLVSTDDTLPDRIRRALAIVADTGATLAWSDDAASVASALPRLHPTVVLVDLCAARDIGLDVISRLRAQAPSLPVLALASRTEEDEVFAAAMRAGGSGYLLKERDDIEIALSLRSALHGGTPIDPFVAGHLLRSAQWALVPSAKAGTTRSGPPCGPLTERERNVLALLATGMTNGKIADAIRISRNTVETHIKRLYSKLEAHTRLEAVHRARSLGLIA